MICGDVAWADATLGSPRHRDSGYRGLPTADPRTGKACARQQPPGKTAIEASPRSTLKRGHGLLFADMDCFLHMGPRDDEIWSAALSGHDGELCRSAGLEQFFSRTCAMRQDLRQKFQISLKVWPRNITEQIREKPALVALSERSRRSWSSLAGRWTAVMETPTRLIRRLRATRRDVAGALHGTSRAWAGV